MINQILSRILDEKEADDIRYTIAHYMRKNIENIPFMSLSEISRNCFVSKGMVSKFLKEIGYESYSSFQEECSKFKTHKENLYTQNEQIQNVLDKNIDIFYQSVKQINASFKEDIFQEFLEDLKICTCLYVYGEDKSYIAYYFQKQTQYSNIPIVVINPLKKEYKVKDNAVVLKIVDELNPKRAIQFEKCIQWNVLDFFEKDVEISDSYLFYFLDVISRYIRS